MRKKLIVFFLSTLVLFSYSDRDMDGVEDKDDKCPNSSLTELVNLEGCTIENLEKAYHLDVILGASYTQGSDIVIATPSLQIDYFYKDFSLQLSSSYSEIDFNGMVESGQNNTYLNGFYQIKPSDNFLLRIGTGIAFPTSDSSSNKADYTLSFYGTYRYQKSSFLMGLGSTLMGDKNLQNENPLFYTLGYGYYISDSFYTSMSINKVESIYTKNETLDTLSFYSYKTLSKNWFLTLNYTHGLNAEALDSSIGGRIGYYW